MKLTAEEIVVLSCRNPCLFLNSYTHQLIREMIPRGKSCQLDSFINSLLINNLSTFILLTDSHCVCLYSYRAENFAKQIR